ncbi:LacI family DNA-binding transcriptional regulator [Paenibacillus athensensis]|uniref:LacI family transcriptional regulator n=1 Tax=Paenibacillus athensensis TaxID=1967502 RepID=A0A4Y8QAF6_9BACL|nr:LacI family DNA-binding transcriptional regulator [Paenibacillus athensensis]MCD1257600.1 LacI family DNA-binding transcriptional regulator [Paenibacillus athensensis]
MRSEDIAKLAGVSRSTVSRVINNYPDIPQKTRDKVLKIIEQYHYEPNTSARVLAGKGTNTIGFFVVSLAEQHNVNRIYQNNYFAPFVDAVIDTANAAGYYVLVHTVYSKEDFVKVKQAFLQKRIDGGIIVGTQKDIDTVRDIGGLGMPLVLIDYDIGEIMEHHLDQNHLAIVNSKDYEGATAAMEYLIGLGHREIGFIAGRLTTFSGRQRAKAYEDALQRHGLPVEEAFRLKGEFLKQNAYDEAIRLIRSGRLPTAIFSANDDMAIAAMEALKEHGVRVPDDVSVIGFDDVPVASQIVPSLSSVRLPIYDMSREAVNKIVGMCEAGLSSFGTSSFPTQLIQRDSCRSLR